MSAPAPPRPAKTGATARIALGLIRLLSPFVGEPYAQWLVARIFGVLYLVRFYIASQYARATLGFLWVLLAPVLLVAVYLPVLLVVFKVQLPGHESQLDYACFCLIGLVLWAAVSDGIAQAASSLLSNAAIVRHSPAPAAMLPVVKVVGSFVALAIGLAIVGLVLTLTGHGPGVRLLILPVAFVLAFGLVLGAGLALSMLIAYVQDLQQALPTLLAVEFFAAPITYWPEAATGKLGLVIAVNPLTPFLALFRAAFLPWHPFAWHDLGLAAAWTAVSLAVGIAVFHRLESGLRDIL